MPFPVLSISRLSEMRERIFDHRRQLLFSISQWKHSTVDTRESVAWVAWMAAGRRRAYFIFCFFAAADLLKQKSQRSDSWSLITCRKVDDGSLPPTYSCGVSARAHAHVSCGASQYFNHQPVRRISIQMEKRKSLAMEDPFPFLTLFASTLGRDTVHAIYWWLLQDFCQIQKSDFSFFPRYLACLFPRANYSFIQTVSLIRFT